MEPNDRPGVSAREIMVVIVVSNLLVAGITGLLIAMLGTWVLVAIIVLIAIVLTGWLHYIIWGRALTQQLNAEREREEAEEKVEDWSIKEPSRIRRF